MYIAHKLKRENICEYLLYMWQIEDLIRAFDFNIDTVNDQIIKKYPVNTDAERKSIYEWFESLIEMMRLENIQQQGHLQINKNTIIDLNEFHNLMLNSGKVASYNAKFFYILPYINQLSKKGESGLSDIEICFNFQYGIMLLRMKKTEISVETLQIQAEISKFMVLLSRNFMLYQNGEIDFEE